MGCAQARSAENPCSIAQSIRSYPPGSTFKQITAVAGLESGAISTSTVYHCNGALMLDKARFGCWAIHGDTDFYKAIAESCDVYFYPHGPWNGAAISRQHGPSISPRPTDPALIFPTK